MNCYMIINNEKIKVDGEYDINQIVMYGDKPAICRNKNIINGDMLMYFQLGRIVCKFNGDAEEYY